MRRREFIVALGGATVWPVAGQVEESQRARRIGVLMNLAATDVESQARKVAFLQGLQQLGWTDGRNVHIDYRWAGGDAERFQKGAAELLALKPDVILASTSPAVAALRQATHSVPIVFVIVIDPVGAGFVSSLERPGGNATGFTVFDYRVAGKWLELLKQIAPTVKRVAVLRDPSIAAGVGQFGAIQVVAPSFGVELVPIDVRQADEIEQGLAEFVRGPQGGMIVTGSPSQGIHRKLIVALAARHRIPAIHPFRYMAADGGLLAYGPDQVEQYRQAADYVDRILKGANPGGLPVQAPAKYELVINLRTARTLGLTVPPILLARADEVIE